MRFFAKWRWWPVAIPFLMAFAGCGLHGGAAPPEKEHASEEGEAHVTVRTEPAQLKALDPRPSRGWGVARHCPTTSPP